MKKLALLFAFAILLSLAGATQFSACLPYPSALGFNVENATYNGSFGNYTVYVQAFPPPSIIRVDGADASQSALISEMELLQTNQMLSTPCNLTKVQVYSYVNYACAPDGNWADADQSNLCSAENAAAKIMPVAANAPVTPPAPGAMDTGANGGAEVMRQSTIATQPTQGGNQAPTVADGQPRISAEQVLPLIAAFLAVVIVSFLILQQRQETVQIEISAQDEMLLRNGTRAGIMEQLEGADRIPTDLSSKLGKSKATIVEHLETLREAGFVERVATPGKKFVYYRLTQKGKRMLLKNAG
ncbi:MAG: winged helix-turn-helix domain-containing protein [Candidatus Micrarchaeota archaeon]|nr:winged helix-turn-helix domain-containing protein [Candidatus Micrarchaeota archaeon]